MLDDCHRQTADQEFEVFTTESIGSSRQMAQNPTSDDYHCSSREMSCSWDKGSITFNIAGC